MNATLRTSLATPIKQFRLLRTQLFTRPTQRTLTTTPPLMPNIPTPLKSQYTKAERTFLATASTAACTAVIGGGLYYYVSQTEGHISGSYAKKNAHVDRKKYDGRADTKHLLPFSLNKID